MQISRRTFSLATVLALAGGSLGYLPPVPAVAAEIADGGFEVSHYGVNLRYQLAPEVLSGTTTILGRATRTLPTFDLHFLLTVSSVSVNNEPAAFTSKDGILKVTPKRSIEEGDDLVVVVRYRDNPSDRTGDGSGGWGWKRTPTGVVSVGSPEWWFPTAFDPADRATQSVVIVVPKGLQALSNGELPWYGGPEPAPGGDKWSWTNNVPQAVGVTLLAIGRYELTTSTGPDGRPFTRAYGADLGDLRTPARLSVERTPEIVAELSKWFGPYPFKAYGGLVDSTFASVVATATRPTYTAGVFAGGANSSVVAHEMTHQWYGLQVHTVGPDTQWLSEGFATYAEFLWSEIEGLGTAAEVAQFSFDRHPADDPVWQSPPSHPDPESHSAFPIYTRGALTLQALRTKVGDDKFFTILRDWVTRQKTDEAATTAQFVALAEEISGQDLDALFQAWIHAAERPATGPNGAFTAQRSAKPKSYEQITANSHLFATTGHHGQGPK
ncbi:M1 family metallopeptidase [Kribbella antibiotica]|nr:M1 family metallopeptidase [Kribbella antibiotica]